MLSGAIVLLVLVGATLPVAFSVTTAALIGSVPETLEKGLRSSAGGRLLGTLTLAASLFTLQHLVGSLTSLITGTLGRRIDGTLRERVMNSALLPSGIAHLEDPSILDRISTAKGGVGPGGFSPGGAVAQLAIRASTYLQGLLFALILSSFRWWMGILVLAPWIWARRVGFTSYKAIAAIYTGHTQDLRRSNYYSDLALRPAAAKETRIFGMEDWILDRYSDHWLDVMKEVWKRRRRLITVGFPPPSIVVWLVSGLSIWLIAMAGVQGNLSLGQVALYVLAISSMSIFAETTSEDLYIAYGFASVPIILGLDEATKGAQLIGGSSNPKGLPTKDLRLEGVSFRYPGSNTEVFSDLNLTIQAGHSLAIVGLNGAGKTTLVKLLSRLYDPDAGQILADGVDVREFPPDEWQSRVSAIFQDYVRYELPIRDNIGFGNLDMAADYAALEEVAELAGAKTLVDRLPKGWETTLSRRYTDGADLSGGEWQKVALARALFAARARPGILVLDEPTANLDVRSEAEIYTRLIDLTRGHTVILISHRFSTVRRAEKICVLEQGRIIEEGTHDELIARSGRYAEMFQLQASRFVEEIDDETSTA